jgi:hypothetical protein
MASFATSAARNVASGGRPSSMRCPSSTASSAEMTKSAGSATPSGRRSSGRPSAARRTAVWRRTNRRSIAPLLRSSGLKTNLPRTSSTHQSARKTSRRPHSKQPAAIPPHPRRRSLTSPCVNVMGSPIGSRWRPPGLRRLGGEPRSGNRGSARWPARGRGHGSGRQVSGRSHARWEEAVLLRSWQRSTIAGGRAYLISVRSHRQGFERVLRGGRR